MYKVEHWGILSEKWELVCVTDQEHGLSIAYGMNKAFWGETYRVIDGKGEVVVTFYARENETDEMIRS